jgi:hypothetical protein
MSWAGSNLPDGMPVTEHRSGSSFRMPMIESIIAGPAGIGHSSRVTAEARSALARIRASQIKLQRSALRARRLEPGSATRLN